MDSTVKWLIIIAGDIILPPTGIPLFSILYFTYKYIVVKIKLDIYTTYFLFLGIPQIVFFGFLHVLGVIWHKIFGFTTGIAAKLHQIFNVLTQGLRAAEASERRTTALFLLFFAIGVFFFPLSVENLMNPSAWLTNIFSFMAIMAVSLAMTLIISRLLAGGTYKEHALEPYRNVREGVRGEAEGVRHEVGGRRQAMDEHSDDLEGAGIVGGASYVAGEIDWLPSNVRDVGLKMFEDMPLIGGETAAGGAAAEGMAERAGQVTGEGMEAFNMGKIAILLVVGGIFMLLQLGIILVLWGFFLKIYLPMVLGPLMGAVGLGAAYGDYVGQTTSNQYFAGFGEIGAVEQTSAMMGQTFAKIGCFAQGPACYRQWQMNNTKRPGSEDVGEQYGLKIESLRVGQGSGLDVAYKDTNYAIPLSFTLSNPRRGLKGIDAKNVSYRLKVIDASKTYCDTGWLPVNGFDIRKDSSEPWKGNDIFPGTSASTGFQTIDRSYLQNKFGDDWRKRHDAFTLRGCKMLQPALGSYKTVMLEVKYTYFSQSTLYFRAMSLGKFRSNPNIQKGMKKSKTADTPVRAAINVNSPVLYDRKELKQGKTAEEAAQPFAVRASLDTEEFDMRYKVEGLVVKNSQETGVYKNGKEGEDCQFRDPNNKGLMTLKAAAENNIIFEEAKDENKGRELWFTRTQKPPIFGCVMYLKDPKDISPTGETLTMGVESNYTVALEKRIGNFKVYNSRCSARLDCPLLVTAHYAYGDSDIPGYRPDDWTIKCSGIDSGNGCSVVEGPTDIGWDRGNLMTGSGKLDRELESGEIAVNAYEITQLGDTDKIKVPRDAAVGLRPSFIKKFVDGKLVDKPFAVASIPDEDGRDVKKINLDEEAPCKASEWKNKMEKGGEAVVTPIIYYPPKKKDKDKFSKKERKKCQEIRKKFKWEKGSGFTWFEQYTD